MLTGDWDLPLLHIGHSGLRRPQYSGPEGPSYVHQKSQLSPLTALTVIRAQAREREGESMLACLTWLLFDNHSYLFTLQSTPLMLSVEVYQINIPSVLSAMSGI